MFGEVESYVISGELKTVFLDGKDYGEAKFNYWLAKWKASQRVDTNEGFREVGISEVKFHFRINSITFAKILLIYSSQFESSKITLQFEKKLISFFFHNLKNTPSCCATLLKTLCLLLSFFHFFV